MNSRRWKAPRTGSLERLPYGGNCRGCRQTTSGAVWLIWLLALVCYAEVAGKEPVACQSKERFTLWVERKNFEFDPSNREDLRHLDEALWLELAKQELRDPTREEKRTRRGLHEIKRLTEELLRCNDHQKERGLKTALLETACAVNNLNRPPLPERVDFFETPWFFLKRLSRPVGIGRTIAANLQPGNESDLSRIDPEPSTFWQRPSSVTNLDLYHGFGRTNLLLDCDPLCTYAAPKESYGRNPGFEVECDGMRMKLKFAEVSSEPFACRIFDAVGYHTDETDYAPHVRVRYSRRILQEFNLRKALKTHFTFLKIVPLFTLRLQSRYDPFDYIGKAVLNDGTIWSGAELKGRLFLNARLPHPEMEDSNFRTEVESSINYLETVPANVQVKTGKSVGPWDFGDLDHARRRELRGAALVAGWVGWFDTRFDNTRLRIVRRNGEPELQHYFSDLGGVLGETTGLLYARGENPNAFPWTFTRSSGSNQKCIAAPRHARSAVAKQRAALPFRLQGYKPVAPTPAFAEMTRDDARWMARLIGALSEEQITQALVASGFDSAQARLYLEKLVSRRDQMIADLGLSDEIPLYGRLNKNRNFSYDPGIDGLVEVSVGPEKFQAPVENELILNGRLTPASAVAQPPGIKRGKTNNRRF